MINKVISIALAASVGVCTWAYQENRYSAKISEINLAYARRDFKLLEVSNSEVIKYQDKLQLAQKEANEKLWSVTVKYDAAMSANKRLQHDLNIVASKLSTSTPESVAQYANTLGILYGRCREALSRMGRAAENHSIDAQKLINSCNSQ